MLKRKKLRHNEYYDMQYHFDSLYAQSANGQNFYGLLDLMQSDENIRLAYRNIKRNTGSNTQAHRKKTNKRILYVAHSHMTRKALGNAQLKVKQAIKAIQKHQSAENVWRFNTVIMGIQNYYSAASHITDDLNELNNRLNKALYNRLNEMRKEASFQEFKKSLQKRYKGYECKLYKIKDMVHVPIHA